MAEILGLTLADKPNLRMHPRWMAGMLQSNVAKLWVDKPHLGDPKNWPEPMRRDWGDDQGEAAAVAFQQHQIEQFRVIRAALDDFNPDFIVVLFREMMETWGDFAYPRYWIQAHEQVDIKLFQAFGRPDSYFGEDPEKVVTIPGHREGALYLVRGLQDAGFDPLYTMKPAPKGLGHHGPSAAIHLDFERREFKTPLVYIAIDPFGYLRTRDPEGLSPWDPTLPRPFLPKEAFELGRAMARIYQASPWRVAMAACVDWSHVNNTAREPQRLYPNIEADRRRYEEWKNNQFDQWGESWTHEEMEENAQWELLVTIVLAGAMTEIGSRVVYSDFSPTWIFADDVVTTIFEPK